MAAFLLLRPAHTMTLLFGVAGLAACGSERAPAPAGADDEPAQASMPTVPAATPAEVAPPAAEPTPSQPAPSEPAPTDGLPLTPGVYVLSGSSCASPANAAFRIFDGRGVSGSATRACRLTIRSSEGDIYRVDQSCQDTYSGSRTTAAQTISVPNARSFTLTEPGETPMSFHLCPAGQAPGYLQDMVPDG